MNYSIKTNILYFARLVFIQCIINKKIILLYKLIFTKILYTPSIEGKIISRYQLIHERMLLIFFLKTMPSSIIVSHIVVNTFHIETILNTWLFCY